MRRRLVKDDIKIFKNNSSLVRTVVMTEADGIINLDWRAEEIDGEEVNVLTLGEIKAQTIGNHEGCINVFVYNPIKEGGAIYRYGDTYPYWAKIGDLYPVH